MNYLMLPDIDGLENECMRCQNSGYFAERHEINNTDMYCVYETRYKAVLKKPLSESRYYYKENKGSFFSHHAAELSFCTCQIGQEKKFHFKQESNKAKLIYPRMGYIGNLRKAAERRERFREQEKALKDFLKDNKHNDFENGEDIW